MSDKKVLLLINIGSPTELTVSAVRKYLRHFLMDPNVIQIPFLLRYIFFYCVICNIRAPRTLKKYQSIWRPDGSPFHFYSEKFRQALEQNLGFRVINLMMYSEPGFETAFAELKATIALETIIVVPMFPQFAQSSYEASVQKFKSFFKASGLTSKVVLIEPFYREEFFIESFHQNILQQFPDYSSYDHIVFSYHGLPQAHIANAGPKQDYQQQCLETTALLAKKLNLQKNDYVTCFQSRVGLTKWITPYLDQTCEELAKNGKLNLLIVSPSFVVDGLETLQEIKDLETSLQANYKIRLSLVGGLNFNAVWVRHFSKFINKFY